MRDQFIPQPKLDLPEGNINMRTHNTAWIPRQQGDFAKGRLA